MKGNPPKRDRNQHLIELREKNPQTYSFSKLGEIFRLSKQTAYEIYERDRAKYHSKKGHTDK